MGAGRTREMIFTSRLVLAEAALAVGLVTELLADKAAVEQRALALAALLSGQSPLTLRPTKEALRRLTADTAEFDDKDLLVLCPTPDAFPYSPKTFSSTRTPARQGPQV